MNSTISISPKKIFQVLTFVVFCLIVLSLIGQFFKYVLGYNNALGFVPLTDVNAEANVPAWFSGGLLLFCSLLLVVIAALKKTSSDRYFRHWLGLSLIFAYLSLDEVTQLHERTIMPLRTSLKATGLLYSTWVLLGATFVGIVLLTYWKFLAHLPAKMRRLFLLSGAIYVGGAIGVELAHGYYLNFYGKDMGYALIATVEEFCEMMGIILFIYTLLSYIKEIGDVYIRIESKKVATRSASRNN